MSQILGIDLGERRIGVSIAEEPGPRAWPLATVRRGSAPSDDVAALRRLVPYGDVELVVGLPLDASGIEGTMARATRAWAGEIQRIAGWPVAFRDERMSSHVAEQRLGPMTRGRSGGPPTSTQRRAYRERVDREAATIILQDELDARAVGR